MGFTYNKIGRIYHILRKRDLTSTDYVYLVVWGNSRLKFVNKPFVIEVILDLLKTFQTPQESISCADQPTIQKDNFLKCLVDLLDNIFSLICKNKWYPQTFIKGSIL